MNSNADSGYAEKHDAEKDDAQRRNAGSADDRRRTETRYESSKGIRRDGELQHIERRYAYHPDADTFKIQFRRDIKPKTFLRKSPITHAAKTRTTSNPQVKQLQNKRRHTKCQAMPRPDETNKVIQS